MDGIKPPCGHSSLIKSCRQCTRFKKKWYGKIQAADSDWKDIEYGLENPKRLYEPVPVEYGDATPEADQSKVDPLTTDYYDRVLNVFHLWVRQGRSKRDCLIAELLGSQHETSGTERGIAAVLKSKRLKPNSRFTVRQTIREINDLIGKIAQGHLSVEQSSHALHLLDSKPKKDEADGKADKEFEHFDPRYTAA